MRRPATKGRAPASPRRRLARGLLLAALVAPLVPGATAAQDPAPDDDAAPGIIAGSIVDAVHGHAIAGATVVLQPDVAGVFPGPATGSGFAVAARTVVSDSAGAYRFEDLPPGVYRVYVTRYSYRPYAVTVELRPGAVSGVSIGLSAEPIALEPVEGRGPGLSPFRALEVGGATDSNRLLALRMRRRRFLTTDVRELTDADVSEAVTLGEPDVLRALQRLPGVAAPSDYSAELWTRGAPWSHTRVYFDGVPLYNPLHALGVLSGIGSAAVGALWFHPGTRSAGIGGGAAGVVDLRTRPASGAGEVNLRGDLSLMSAGLALDQRVLDGRIGWMVAGRRTYLDWLSELAHRATGTIDEFPYGFRELTGRIDARIGAGAVLEVSGLWERDRLARAEQTPAGGQTGGDQTGEGEAGDAGGAGGMRSEWGNAVARAALTTRIRGLNVRHTAALSRHDGVAVADSGGLLPDGAWTGSASRAGYVGLSGAVWPDARTVSGPDWTLGYGIERHTAEYDGPMPVAVPASDLHSTGSLEERLWTAWSLDLPMAVLWGERTWAPDDRLSLRAGLRVEAGTEVRDAGEVRIAPRLAARLAASPEVAVSAGYARVFQYTQAMAPAGLHLASLTSGDVWLVAGPDVPALRADVLTFGLEAWPSAGRVLSLNWFGRRTTGVAMTDPRPGPVFGRSALIAGESLAYGIEASLRQVAGPVTGTAAYTFSRSRTTALGLEFPSGSDRTHVLDATLMIRALPGLRLGAGFTGATAAPYTRMVADTAGCLAEPECEPSELPWASSPHAERGPAFASLDLLADWSTRVGDTEIGIYLQLRNALGRRNATVYIGGGAGCLPEGCDDERLHNAYERGIPRLPVLGIRVRR